MPNYLKTYIGLLFCLMPFTAIYAQQDSAKTDKGFNALQYSLQKRYRAKGYGFKNNNFKDNTYLSVQLGMEGMVHREGADIKGGPRFGLSAGKLFTSAHSGRVSLNGGWFGHDLDNDKLYHFGIGASYLFNITSYLKGYNPYRLLEVSTVAGLGYQLSCGADETFQVGEFHLGAQLKIHIHRQIDFFIEPLVTFYTDGIDHYSQKNWHKYDVGYSASIGFIYRPEDPLLAHKRKGEVTAESSFLNNTFVSVAGGMQFQNSDFVKDMGILNSMGPHINISIGKWYVPYLGLRCSGFYSTDKWHELPGKQFETTTYAGLRAEGMLNVFGFIKDRKWAKRLSLSGLLGAEIGNMNKTDADLPIKTTYIGLTGGVQLKCNITKQLAVFIEPRGSLVPYSNLEPDPANPRNSFRKNYSDNVFNLNIGIELRRPN